MIKRDYFSHDIPGYGRVFDVMSDRGYCYHVAGENIGWNNSSDATATGKIHNSFMNSSGHRSNILGRDWDVIGIGAYKGANGKKMWTVIFADKCGSVKPKPKPSREAEAQAGHQAEARPGGPARDPEADEEADPEADGRADTRHRPSWPPSFDLLPAPTPPSAEPVDAIEPDETRPIRRHRRGPRPARHGSPETRRACSSTVVTGVTGFFLGS